MTKRDREENLLDALAADAPMERLQANFEERLRSSRRRSPRQRWIGPLAAGILLAAGLVIWWPSAPRPTGSPLVARIEAPTTFERLAGVHGASPLAEERPELRAALLRRLDEDPSLNVRLAALGALFELSDERLAEMRWVDHLANQQAAIVQAHLGLRLRQRGLVSEAELERWLAGPGVHGEVRRVLGGRS
ncbi:MAG: hypothetical protein AAF604_09345 [Acidobacteriota bacterium]